MAITGIDTRHQDERLAVEELVAAANPTDQYVVVVHPLNGKPIVSEVSGTKWQGA